MIKNAGLFTVLLLLSITGFAQVKLSAFPLSSVELLNSPFKEAQQTDLLYMLQLDPDRLLAPFLKEAGLPPKNENYGNWENTGLDGHIGGHYLSALSNMYAATGDKEVLRRLNYMIDWLDSCQRKDGNGYVGAVPGGKSLWKEIAAGNIKAGSFSLNDKWVPLYNMHKLFAGLRDAYMIAGNEKAKGMLIKLSGWFIAVTKDLSDDQMQQMLRSEHGGMNEVFADVAAITGDTRYLEMARKLSHKAILTPLLQEKDSLTGLHANTQIPKVIGYKRIAEIGGDSSWLRAAEFFWTTVVQHRTVSIGGNSVREHFHPATNFSPMIDDVQGPETCNTYNMLRLTEKLYLSNPKSAYIDYYERAVFNHILSSQNPKGGFVYFTPMRPQHYRVYSQPQQSFWCCVGSGMENHGRYGQLIYAHDENDLFVNLFIASKLVWKEKGLSLIQQTNFPYEQTSSIRLTVREPRSFAVHLRHPSWLKEAQLQITVNGQPIKAVTDENGFVSIKRTWRTGDQVAIRLPMQAGIEYLPDGSPWASFTYGPIVLAAKTDTANLVGLKADGSRMGHVANGPLYPIDKAPMIVSSQKDPALQLKPVKNKPLHFTMADLVYPASFKHLTLHPFNSIHDARYMIYWRVTDEKGLNQIQQKLNQEEKQKLELENNTVDQVAPGEQQSEVDHQFKGDRTETGVFKDKHWRRGSGWFSYQLKNDQGGKKLRVTYYGTDKSSFEIFINGTLLKKEDLDGAKGDSFFDIDYAIPEHFFNGGPGFIDVKFSAADGKMPRIFYVRLMK
ncbi:glycoside hydrolase family 127 protein [Longitalea arenae]|uniref:glycoside hydrolase family 127 protein n=1 Tax=Longitalea arenae TaxID=2812558 RepID=UPI0019683E5F|nr:glycoside hydrolase family 127 protein [Longitalea arenae]